MPISITPTQPGGAVGPGLEIFVSSDFVGPLPANSNFYISLRAPTAEQFNEMQATTIFTQQKFASVRWNDVDTPLTVLGPRMVTQGQSVNVVVELRQGSTVIDTGATTAVWDGTSGLGTQIPDWIESQGGGTGGLTPAQALELQRADVASQLALDGSGLAQLLGGVLQAGSSPPFFFLCTLPPITGQTGTGTLPVPHSGLAPLVVGLTWLFTTVPPFVGRRNGFVTQYQGRVMQLVAQHQLDHNAGLLLWSDIAEFNVDNTIYLFKNFLPSAIGFDIAPGFVAQFQFIQVCAP